MALLKDVPLDFITTTYEVIDTLSKKYAYPVQEYIYVTLTDHIFCSYQAVQQGRYKYSDLPDVSAMHPIPYKIAKEAIEIFRKRLLDQFPDDEVNRIAYHFINAQGQMIHEQRSRCSGPTSYFESCRRKTSSKWIETERRKQSFLMIAL